MTLRYTRYFQVSRIPSSSDWRTPGISPVGEKYWCRSRAVNARLGHAVPACSLPKSASARERVQQEAALHGQKNICPFSFSLPFSRAFTARTGGFGRNQSRDFHFTGFIRELSSAPSSGGTRVADAREKLTRRVTLSLRNNVKRKLDQISRVPCSAVRGFKI